MSAPATTCGNPGDDGVDNPADPEYSNGAIRRIPKADRLFVVRNQKGTFRENMLANRIDPWP